MIILRLYVSTGIYWRLEENGVWMLLFKSYVYSTDYWNTDNGGSVIPSKRTMALLEKKTFINITQYSHNHWIIFTFTIERLQVMAKRIMSKLTEQKMN